MQLVTPSFEVGQDDAYLYVRLSCRHTKAQEARIVAEGHTFGCFIEPVYLPLQFPCAVDSLGETCALDKPSPTCTYDAAAQTLTVRVKKRELGQVAGLESLRPQILSNAEMAQMEKDAREHVEFPYGLMYTHEPLPHAYVGMIRSGKVPILDVADPTTMPLDARTTRAEDLETQKWDEGMYLDSYVDMDGEVQAVIAVTPKVLGNVPEPQLEASMGPVPCAKQASALLLQVLFAYLYEMHLSYNDASTESAWTLCKLCRSLSCFAEARPDETGLHDVLRASYRRALTYPLYRSWALCERVQQEMHALLSDTDVKSRLLYMLRDIDGMLALAPTGTGLAEPMEMVLHVVWDVWLAPLQVWVQAVDNAELHALAAHLPIALSKEQIGSPGEWDLALLEWAAREADEHGEAGGFV